jgi:hypothetical protein
MSDWDKGYEAAKVQAIEVALACKLAFQIGAGKQHSEEAQKVGKAVASWIAGEIDKMVKDDKEECTPG